MPRFRQINEILRLMNDKKGIRNLGIIAHIDHGKTTLTDALLAGAGLLSPSIAGTARVLDYLEEEQKRKITMKTANISLLYDQHVINLVDTPGHVDFTGKVSRALRAIDGAIVVVDAVEEIMAQTEVVTRQAMEDRVRPILFINKIDRLVTEMQLTPVQIEKKLQQIIEGFNTLIELYGEEPFTQKWKANPASNNVIFGSALHRWGFTIAVAKQRDIKFHQIAKAYKNGQIEKLREKLSLHESVFNVVIDRIPNPQEAQSYRIEKIWGGHPQSPIGKLLSQCADVAPTVVWITNVTVQSNGGVSATGRLFSGVARKDAKLYVLETQIETLVKQVYVPMGAFKEEVGEVSAGNIASLALTGNILAGQTLVSSSQIKGMVPFENLAKVSEPVITVAVEPKKPQDLPILLEKLGSLEIEDPDLRVERNAETGEILLLGMGELHLEVALKTLDAQVPVTCSPPRVAYRETVTESGIDGVAKSTNKQNSFVIKVEPLPQESNKFQIVGDEKFVSVDEFRNTLVDSCGRTESVDEEELEAIIQGFEFACHSGPLCGEPMRHVKINIVDFQLSPDSVLRSSEEIMRAVGKAIFGSFLTAKPVLLEPVYRTVLSVPIELTSECVRIVNSRRGRVSGFEQRGQLSIITGFVPVAESIDLSKDLRSATSGRAFWQDSLECWERLPQKLQVRIIAETRERKGLALEVPKANVFLEYGS